MDIDDLLAREAPPSADRTPELKEALRLMAAAAESQARTPRRARHAARLAGVTAVIVGVGAAGATAAGFVPGWVPWTTGEGSNCTMLFGAEPAGVNGEPLEYEYSPEVRAAAVAEANRFFATFDLDSIDEAGAIREWQMAEDARIASMPPEEQAPRLTGDDLALHAMWGKVNQALHAHLVSEGLPTGGETVTVSMAWRCE